MKTLTAEEIEARITEVAAHFGAAIDAFKATFPELPYGLGVSVLETLFFDKLDFHADAGKYPTTIGAIVMASNETVAKAFVTHLKANLHGLAEMDEETRSCVFRFNGNNRVH